MKKLFFIVLILFITGGFIFAGDWVKLNASGIVDVAVAENGTICVVNYNGHLYISKDAGNSWEKSAVASGILRVSMNSNASVIGVVNLNKDFYISKDGGKSWVKSTAAGIVDSSVGRSYTFVVNANNEVYYTKDYASWTKTNIGNVEGVIYGGEFIMFKDTHAEVKTADFSGNPLMSPSKKLGSGIVDIDIAPDGRLWVSNKNGELYFSSDRGKTWKKDPDAGGIRTVSLCNKYTVISNNNKEVYLRTN